MKEIIETVDLTELERKAGITKEDKLKEIEDLRKITEDCEEICSHYHG